MPGCCSTAWTAACALACQYGCGGDCGLGCGDGVCAAPDEACDACVADCGACPTGGGEDVSDDPGCYTTGNDGCNDCACEDWVCDEEEDCCDGNWGLECTQLCFEHGDCGDDLGCVPHEDEGCDDCACEDAVCAQMPGCCNNHWTTQCVNLCTAAGSCQGVAAPACDDGACNGEETCGTCPQDCGACPACGDGACSGAEACGTCPQDCGVCAGGCGDAACGGVETCTTCPADCGACPADCGDGACEAGETCSNCPGDCGDCPPQFCGDDECTGSETFLNCHADCAPWWMTADHAENHCATFMDDPGACKPCHGATLEGGVKSCDTCHPGWKTNCTFCHGGMDNQTGAPPWTVAGSATAAAVGAHTLHLSDSDWKNAYSCDMCHVVPADALSPGHIDGDGVAEVDLNDCNGGTWSHASGTCSSVYCHGNGKSTNQGGSATWTGGALGCNSCHPNNGLGGEHGEHNFACGTCHNQTATGSNNISNPDNHVNCVVDVSGPFTFNGSSCSSISCHGGESW